MNRRTALRVLLPLVLASPALGQTSIAPNHKHAWGENIGWTNWRDANGGSQGVRVHATFLSGFIWGENVGWINVGDGTPTNGVSYANANGTDFGVNLSGGGALTGLAWGENIGWINLAGGSLATPAQPARLEGGRFKGYAWGENVGWINLDHATHYVALLCGPDCEEDGDLDVFDFLCFQGKFAAQDPYADFEGDGDWDIFDFLAYQNAFALGCP